MKNILLFLLVFIMPRMVNSQEEKDRQFGISFKGFVKSDIFYDTRQVTAIRNDHLLLYPANESLDINGVDLNDRPHFNMLSIQTRLRGNVTAPDAFGAKTSAVIEGEFFGHSNGDINGFRLRHAFVKLSWKKSSLMVGQNWHPMFITSCYPGTVSFNTGIPFLPFSRNPQIRYGYKAGNLNIYASLYSQLDFKSNGPDGSDTKYLRNSVLPAFNMRIEYHKKTEKNEFLTGATGNYKILTPRLVTLAGYNTYEKVGSYSASAYLKIQVPKLTFKLQGTYGQDAYDLTMIGGYAVKDSTAITCKYTYTPINTIAVWTDIHTNGKKMQAGIFLAYTKNMGAKDSIMGFYYSRGSNIDYVFRISPRFIYNTGKFRIAPEIEYTVAAFGTTDAKGIVRNSKEKANLRFLLGVYLFF